MAAMPRELATDRLVLRQFRDDDLDAFAAIQADPDALRRGRSDDGPRAAVAFEHLGVDRLISLIRPGNAASVRVAVKLGAQRRDQIDLDGHPTDVYALDRSPRRSR